MIIALYKSTFTIPYCRKRIEKRRKGEKRVWTEKEKGEKRWASRKRWEKRGLKGK